MRVMVSENVVVRDLGDEAILLDLDTSTYFGLDAVGARIWHLLAEGDSPETIVPQLMREFEVDEHVLRPDLTRLVQQLLQRRLLIAVDNAPLNQGPRASGR